MGAGGKQIGDERHRRQHMLAVVQQQEHPLVAQEADHPIRDRPVGGLSHPERPRDGTRHVGVGGHGRETDEVHVVRDQRGDRLGHRETEARLPHPADPRECQQAHIVAPQERRHRRDIGLPPEQRRRRDGQRRRRSAGGRAASPRDRRLQRGSLRRAEAERRDEHSDRLAVGRPPQPALQRADRLRGQPRPLAQRLLGEARADPILPEQRTEGRPTAHCHSPTRAESPPRDIAP